MTQLLSDELEIYKICTGKDTMPPGIAKKLFDFKRKKFVSKEKMAELEEQVIEFLSYRLSPREVDVVMKMFMELNSTN